MFMQLASLIFIILSVNVISAILLPANIIKEEGYPSESHEITTSDGYLLTVHRIPGKPGSSPVFLQHGLLGSSANWLAAGKPGALPYILFDNGYDVWIGNARGNTYSSRHTSMSSEECKFWDFSWEEQGRYDHPAVFKYIYSINPQKMVYIGHSMGATTFSVFAIERPDLATMFKGMIALGPATYENNMIWPIRLWLAPFWKSFKERQIPPKYIQIITKNIIKQARGRTRVWCFRPSNYLYTRYKYWDK